MSTSTATWTPAKAMYRIPEVAEIISLCKTVVYERINTGRLKSVREGGTRLVTAEAIAEYVGQRGPTSTTRWTPAKAMYRIPEVIEIISLSRSVVYELIRAGRLDAVHEGGARRITAEAIFDYVAMLTAEAQATEAQAA